MNNCVFCQIVAKVLPANTVYEDEHFLAFLDIRPVQPGHLLVIPKEHYPMIVDTPDEVVGQAFVITKKIMIAMKKALGCDFVMISVVGTDVPHFHIQLIPRRFDDGLRGWPTKEYSENEASEISQKIKQELA
jgi:histidine triad (HIT) family protein